MMHGETTAFFLRTLEFIKTWISPKMMLASPWRRRSPATAERRRVTSSSPLLQRDQCRKIDSRCRRSRFIDQLCGRRFQFLPSRQRIGGRKDDVAKYAAPLHQRAFDIAVTQQFASELVFGARISHERAYDFRGVGAVSHR